MLDPYIWAELSEAAEQREKWGVGRRKDRRKTIAGTVGEEEEKTGSSIYIYIER